jgi:hypothetical protein
MTNEDRYTVTEYERRTFWTGDGVEIVRENERDTFTGTAEEAAAHLIETLRENYGQEIDHLEQIAAETGEPEPFSEARKLRADLDAMEDEARELVRYAQEGTPEELGMDPEPSTYATVTETPTMDKHHEGEEPMDTEEARRIAHVARYAEEMNTADRREKTAIRTEESGHYLAAASLYERAARAYNRARNEAAGAGDEIAEDDAAGHALKCLSYADLAANKKERNQ